MTPSTLTHRGMTIGICDELTFKMALLLWEDIAQQWEPIGNIPKDAPIQPTTTTVILNGDEQTSYTKCGCNAFTRDKTGKCNLHGDGKTPINRTLGGKGYQFVREAPTIEECFIKFPNVPRENIERIWFNAHPPIKQEPEQPKAATIYSGVGL